MSKLVSGFTLIELLLVSAIITILFTVLFVVLRPTELFNKSYDDQRITDLGKISVALEEFHLATGSYPGEVDVVYTSVDKPTISALQANNGWIPADLSRFLPKLPIDPKNGDDFIYRYTQDGERYELDAKMANLVEKSSSDSGNNEFRFELGSNLDLLD